MAAIFAGVDEIIDQSLGVRHIGTTAPHYRHRSAAFVLNHKPPCFLAPDVRRAILTQIKQNWIVGQQTSPRRPSGENWRWEKKLHISERNTSREKVVEKAIAAGSGEDWVNQVPTASGLLNSTSERHCNIDLVHQVAPGEFECIELKYDSDTPMFAAFEILKYGLLYVFSRQCATELGYSVARKPLLAARTLHLRVLAPSDYYRGFELCWLEDELNRGLAEEGCDGCRMDFRFEFMRWPYDGDVIAALGSRTALYVR